MENLSGVQFRSEVIRRLDLLLAEFKHLENLKFISDGLVTLHNEMEKIHWTAPSSKVAKKKT